MRNQNFYCNLFLTIYAQKVTVTDFFDVPERHLFVMQKSR